MLKSYLLTAWRNIRKNKVFSAINVVGLAIGMAACLLILQYVNFELSYDQFNKNLPNLYRVYNDRFQNGKLIQHGTITYSGIGQAMQNDYPEVVDHSRMRPWGPFIASVGGKKIGDQKGFGVDNSFLSMFSYDLVAGDKRTALKQPYCVVITASAANRYFGVGTNDLGSVLGKALMIDADSIPYKVTGVMKDMPETSHLSFDVLVSYVTTLAGRYSYKEADYNFTESNFWHYIQLRPGTDYKELEAKLPAFSDKYFQGNKVTGFVEKFYLQPVSRAHLYSDFEYELGITGSATVVWGLLIIALFIIVIAWVNYINLSTARSAERAKEVGVRKVIGAERGQLIRQFLMESFLINAVAVILAIGLMIVAQKAFNVLIGHQLSYEYLLRRSMNGYAITLGLPALILLGVFVSAFYPAFVLSSFRPILVLKGKFTTSKKGIVLRKGLVVGQFAITVALIVGSLVVYRQIRFMNKQDLGMNIDHILMLQPPSLTNFDSTFIDKENTLRYSLSQLPGVSGAATAWNRMGGETGRSFSIRRADQDNTVHLTMRQNGVSAGFIGLYKIRLLAGRDFVNTDFNPDFNKLHNLILNERATKLLGFNSPGDAIGKLISRGGKLWTVVGVIDNYHQKSLRFELEPIMLLPAYSTYSDIAVRVNTSDMPSTIASIKKIYDSFFPGNYFNYYFLDEQYNKQYATDKLFGKAFGIFAGFAIFIACLGLLGLSLFATMQRTKEIGVRKVLGASVGNIVLLLSGDFIRLVLLAIVIASPLAWFVMHRWLQDFAYRVEVAWWVFAIAGMLTVAIALVTISFQAIRAALANPVRALRSE